MNKRTLTAIIAAVGLNCCTLETKSTYVSQEKLTVEQIFRDHDGYRIYFTDQYRVLQERKYFINPCYGMSLIPKDLPTTHEFKFIKADKNGKDENPILIIKDLEPGMKGYANILNYSAEDFRISNVQDCTHVEIHLPANQKLSPGNDCTGGRFPEYPPMHEIK